MKKLLVIFSAGCICLLTSCSGKKEGGGMSDKAKKNLEASQAIAKMFESGDWSKVGDYIAADGIDHASMNGHDIVGLDSIKANFNKMTQMMSNFKNEVVKEMADDDYVFQWMKETSTMKVDDPMSGMKAGSTSSFNAIEVSKFKDGKVAEHWSFVDWNDAMKMMQPPPAAPMDTMKHN
jgi:predicted SnoaL-like aldol condensation-catalyzing enzyme